MSDDSPEFPITSGCVTRTSLIDRLQASDPAGWERLVGLYRPLLCHWARRFGVSAVDVDDVCQDVFRVVTQRIGVFRLGERPGSFRAWLREITRNICREQARPAKPSPQATGGTDAAIRLNEIPDPVADEDDPTDLVADLLQRTVTLVHGEFSDAHWEVFERLTFGGQSPAQVAVDLGLTSANVRAIKSRIYRRLREELGDVFETPASARNG